MERQVIRAVVGSVVALLLMQTKADPDLWGHIRFGGDILRDGLHAVDPYSFTSDVPWINHEWLAEVMFWGAWSAAGGVGLIALKMLLLSGMIVMVWYVLRHASLSPTARDLLLLLVILGTWPRTSLVRPQLFSVLLFAVLLWLLRSADGGFSRRVLYVAPLFAAWINLHGGWIVGFGGFGLWLVVSLLMPRRPVPRAALLCAAGLSAAALFANPYGGDMLRFMAHTVRFDRADIVDWQPIWTKDFLVLGPWVASAAMAIYILVSRRGALAISYVLIVIALGLGSARVGRLDAFFALAVVMLLGPALGTSAARSVAPKSPRLPAEARVAASVVGLGILAAVFVTREQFSCVRLDVPWMPDREAGAFLQANQLKGRLLSWFGWGEYVIWHFGPDLLVSIDGRRETVYSASFLKEHDDLYERPGQNLAMLERLNADFAWLPPSVLLVPVLEAQGWTKIFSGPKSVILARRPLAVVDPPSLTGPGCFPGP